MADTPKIRTPIVCVLGHVDHGKDLAPGPDPGSSVVDHEAGAITQHIGQRSYPLTASSPWPGSREGGHRCAGAPFHRHARPPCLHHPAGPGRGPGRAGHPRHRHQRGIPAPDPGGSADPAPVPDPLRGWQRRRSTASMGGGSRRRHFLKTYEEQGERSRSTWSTRLRDRGDPLGDRFLVGTLRPVSAISSGRWPSSR